MWIKEINAWLKKHNVDPESCSITSANSVFLKREIKGHSVYMEYFLDTANLNEIEKIIYPNSKK